MSRQELADAANTHAWTHSRIRTSLDGNHIGKLERGEYRWPQAIHREAIRAVLHAANDADVGFYITRESPAAAATDPSWTTTSGVVHIGRIATCEVLERIAGGLHIDRGQLGLAYERSRMNDAQTVVAVRRIETKLEGPVSRGVAYRPDRGGSRQDAFIVAAAEESAELGRTASGSNIGAANLDTMETSLDQAARDLLAGPLMPLVVELRHLRDEAFAKSWGRQRPGQSRRLYAVGARACGLLASVTADRFGFYEAAAQHARTASVAADLAEESALCAWTASLLSTILFWQGRYRSAAETAQAAQGTAPAGVETSRLASLEARAWAKLGDRDAMRSALNVAYAARDQVGPQAGVGLIAFPRFNQIRIAGTAYLWIGDSAKARDELRDALRFLADEYDSPPHIAATRTDLAIANLGCDALDEAADVLQPLLDSPADDTYFGGAARRGSDLTTVLSGARFAKSPLARDLSDKVIAFTARQGGTSTVVGLPGATSMRSALR